MIEAIEPLGTIPGVRAVVLVSPDGVPVVVHGAQPYRRQGESELSFANDNPESLAGLAAGWFGGVGAALRPLSWDSPTRAVLRASRGTLVMTHAPGATLLVVLDPGGSPDDLRLPMEAAVARMERILKRRRQEPSPEPTPEATPPQGAIDPPSILPSTPDVGELKLAPADPASPSPRELPG